jgi:hypothetical protein
MSDPFDAKHPWHSLLRLLLIAILVAMFLGIPLGFLAVVYTWTGWMWWAVPAAVGLVTFAVGATILTVERFFRLP